MSIEHWLLYLAAAIGLSLTPGPNGLLVLTQAIRFGARRAAWSALGGVIGFLVVVGASLAGLGALLAASERAFWVVKTVGAVYLVVLGVQLWRAPAAPGLAIGLAAAGRPTSRDASASYGRDPDRNDDGKGGRMPSEDFASAAGRGRALFVQGFLVAVSNPKALIFFTAFLPQFMVPGLSLQAHFLVLGGTFALVEFVYELAVAVAAGRIAPWLSRHGRLFNRVAGSLFILIGGMLARASR